MFGCDTIERMTETADSLHDRILHTDDDLREALEVLLERANIRQMWLVFIDQSGCLGGPLMPMNDYPADPAEFVEVDDLGVVTHAQLLMSRAGSLRTITGNAEVVLVWERTGDEGVLAADAAWAQAMAESAQMFEVPLRAQFILHSRGVRQLHPDDYV